MFLLKRGDIMLEVQSENTEVISNSTVYAVKILNEVKASYAAFAERDFGTTDELPDDILTSNSESKQENIVNVSNVLKTENNDTTKSNCLALVVRKDYNLTIVKNIFTTTGRLSWKIALISAIINVLNMLF